MLNSYNHIFIIPCSKKKIWTKGHIGPIEAKDAYISTYFRLCKEYTPSEKFPLSQTFHINKKTAGLL